MSATRPAPTVSADPRATIRQLPPNVVNRIAAGEVIERPAAVVKELAENAIDAGATDISVSIEAAGKRLITITDNGCGMDPSALCLALQRHATSKLSPDDAGDYDLLAVATMGFRGEALPSIGSVSRLTITSRPRGEEAWSIACEGGTLSEPTPARFAGHGTRIEVADLFYATPARLKFLKVDRAEAMAISAALKALAMARPDIAFSLEMDGRKRFAYRAEPAGREGHLARLGAIMGAEFAENAVPVDAERDGARLSGFAGVPTFHRGQADRQYLFVNGRPVRDKLFVGAVRGAYADFLARDRHPQLALFLDLPLTSVDVNVHPAKTEVRFQNAASIRGLIVTGLRSALEAAGHKASTTISAFALGRMTPGEASTLPPQQMPLRPDRRFLQSADPSLGGGTAFADPQAAAFDHEFTPPPGEAPLAAPSAAPPVEDTSPGADAFPLGAARAQLHETYIVAQTADGIVIVDQHAAHERLLYEEMKAAMDQQTPPSQRLLIPEIVELPIEETEALLAEAEQFTRLGLVIEAFGEGAILVREVPALFGKGDVKGLVQDLAADLLTLGKGFALEEQLGEICGNMACRSAIKAGRRLTPEEMNHLLRRMEATPHSGQCNHGRPTYVTLQLADIEKLFGRR